MGADAGFAAFIGIGLLAILYFAQARETASLRQRLEEAQDRITGMEARVAQLLHLQQRGGRQPPAPVPSPAPSHGPAPVTPPPASLRPMGSAIASVRRVPSAAPATAAMATVAEAAVAAAGSVLPAAPLGMGAPALASATKLIPDPAAFGAPAPGAAHAPDETLLVPGAATAVAGAGTATAAASGNGHGGSPVAPPATPPARPEAAGAAPAPASPGNPPAPPKSGPPPVQIRSGRAAAAAASRPQTAASRAEQRLEAFDLGRAGGRRRFGLAGRILPIAIGLIAIAVIVVGLYVITQTKSGTVSGVSHTGNTAGTTGKHKATAKKAPAFNPAKVTVAVLNGTAVN
ncbi:MAG TPA: hypothetical protein VME01_06365, partial [Solirubrobacteraceae bacterium]|nr:hypothetical protein [Solirubrobacteraceae bacterium]